MPLPPCEVTPEAIFLQRRALLKAMGLGLAGAAIGPLLAACDLWSSEVRDVEGTLVELKLLKARPDPRFELDRPLTGLKPAASVCNFYEFTESKAVWRHVQDFVTKPWSVRVGGLVENPLALDVTDIVEGRELGPLEERPCRFRCVEAWAMTVPWIGLPLRRVIEAARPRPQARYVRFTSFLRPEQAPNQRPGGPYQRLWPYVEGLTLPEAFNDAAFLAVGMYGRELPKQNGAPVRVIVPWKYGYKSPKSITAIELTAERPATFWNTLAPHEYGFFSNVDPATPHPRWSQATERLLGTGERVPTLPLNGYGEFVAHLYDGLDKSDPRHGFGRG